MMKNRMIDSSEYLQSSKIYSVDIHSAFVDFQINPLSTEKLVTVFSTKEKKKIGFPSCLQSLKIYSVDIHSAFVDFQTKPLSTEKLVTVFSTKREKNLAFLHAAN